MTTFARRSNVITKTRQAATQLLDAYEDLLALQSTWNNAVFVTSADGKKLEDIRN